MRSGGEEHRRRHADQQGDGQLPTGFLGAALVVRKVVAVAQAQPEFAGVHVHGAMEGQVGHAGIRIARQHDGRREIGSGIALVIGDERQVRKCTLLHVPRRRNFGLRRLDAGFGGVQDPGVSRREGLVRAADDLPQARGVGEEIGRYLECSPPHVLEQQGPVARLLGALRDRGQLESRIDFTRNGKQFARFGEPIQPGPHGAASG